MKENEKKGILILVIISIVVILALVMILKPGKNNQVGGKNPNQGQTSNEQNQGQTSNGQNQGQQLGEYTKLNQKGDKINTSEKINQTKETSDFTISNVSLREINGETTLSASLTNKSEKKLDSFSGNIVLLDKQNKEIGKIPVRVSAMNVGECRNIEASITENYVNAYDYRLEK